MPTIKSSNVKLYEVIFIGSLEESWRDSCITLNNRLLEIGLVGSPDKLPHCSENRLNIRLWVNGTCWIEAQEQAWYWLGSSCSSAVEQVPHNQKLTSSNPARSWSFFSYYLLRGRSFNRSLVEVHLHWFPPKLAVCAAGLKPRLQ